MQQSEPIMAVIIPQMEIYAYLARLGHSKPIRPDVETLYGLHAAHLMAVPFENLDIALKQPLVLSQEALWKKVILRGRGGFCYELNGLFAWLLKKIGFNVTYLNARVFNRAGELGIEFDHLALLVEIPGQSTRWLADVGFGDSFVEPLNFYERGEQVQGLRAYRLEQTLEGYVTWQRNYDGAWERQYFFDLAPRKFPEDYEAACLYHQTSSASSFTRGSTISRATPDGRLSLQDGRLIVTKNGERTEERIANKDQYRVLLKELFGVEL
jgi:N-hydroxyarylamine O-acetyltransferase